MSVLPIVRIGHPALRRRCAKLPAAAFSGPKLKELIRRMIKTMHAADGVGLAANQVAVDLDLMTLECRSNRRYPGRDDFPLEVYANLRILKYSRKTVSDWEGCLSIPGYRGLVPRAESVTFEAFTPEGKKVRKTVRGFHARVIQHETDHLHGLLYVDRMPDMSTFTHLEMFGKG